MGASTQYGANYAAAASPLSEDYLQPSQRGGKVRAQIDVATLTANSDIGSLIYIGKLRKGDIPIRTTIKGTNVSNAVTGTIGWAGDTDALGTFTTLATNVAQVLSPTVYNTPLTEDKDIYITTAGANAEADDVIVTTIEFTRE
jgi:hypothetical protein